MPTVTFNGVAPIPSGTHVKLLVDDPAKPTIAMSIDDTDHKISYSSETPPPPAGRRAVGKPMARILVANYVTATVDSATIYVNANQTALALSNVVSA